MSTTHREVIARLDARHDELIQKLDALNADIERVLTEFAKSRKPDEQGAIAETTPAAAPSVPTRRAA